MQMSPQKDKRGATMAKLTRTLSEKM